MYNRRMSLTRSIARNTITQFAAKAVSIVFGVLTIGIITRYLGQEGFGKYATIVAFLQFLGILVDFGLQLSSVNLMSNGQNDEGKIFNNAMSLRILTAFTFFAIAPMSVFLFPYSQDIKLGVLLLSVNYIALAINQVLIGLFQKHLQMHKVALAEIIGRIVLLSGTFYVAKTDAGFMALLMIINLSSLIQVGLSFVFSTKLNRFRWAFDWLLWKKIISDSWPIAISILFNLIYFKADTIVLSLTQSQVAVGIYSAPYRVLEVLTTFPYLFVGLMFPLIAKAWNEADKEKYKKYFQATFDSLAFVALPLIAGTIPLADKLMVLIAGPDFVTSGPVLQILIVATAIIFVNTVFGYSIVILNKQKQLIFGYILTAAMALTCYIIFIPRFSYIAAAYITILAESTIFLINIFVSSKTSGFFPSLKNFAKSLFCSVIIYLFLTLTPNLSLLASLPITIILYLAALYLIGGIKKEMIREIISQKS
jgi:O-antigen/teichoic acid export membrane protein